ncbi:MAG: ABC transporter permease [Phycisphaerae bacterium]|nr:ABC transporter permease [Phycisphaerae bacterium]
MTTPRTTTLLRRNLQHNWRVNLGVLLGAAVACAVLVGALAVGDSVRGTLSSIARARLGEIDIAVLPADRHVRAALADDLAPYLDGQIVAPAMLLRGSAVTPDETHRANRAEVLGVDERFGRLSPTRTGPAPRPGEVVLNRALAARLNAAAGDDVLLLVPRPSLLPREAVLARTSDTTLVLRRRVKAVVGPERFGRFSLTADQASPLTAFVNLTELADDAGEPGRANAIFIGHAGGDRDASNDLLPAVADALGKTVTVGDLDLQVRRLVGDRIELRTGRVFLAPPLAGAAQEQSPPHGGVLTYLVNELASGERTTPYSMVSALETGTLFANIIPDELADDEIVINDWLADDLDAAVGDSLTLTYFVLGEDGDLTEASRTFTVTAIVPMDGPAGDPTFMPDLPGIAEEANCRDWDAGIPIDLGRIRDKDEAYWDAHRGTPKAFVSLAAGQAIWASRFGQLTAVRYAAPSTSPDALAAAVLGAIDLPRVGLTARDVRMRAGRAVEQSLDFGGLFLGLSVFLIAAAVLLTALLFVFGVQQRAQQIGTLRAMGWTRRRVTLMMMGEGGLLAAAGCVIGLPLGLAYTQAIVVLLRNVWAGAVASFPVEFHVTAATVGIGVLASLASAKLAMYLTLRRAMDLSPRALLAGAFGRVEPGRRRRWPIVAAGLCAVGAAWLVTSMRTATGMAAAGAFFAAGALLLSAGLLATAHWLSGPSRTNGGRSTLTFWRLVRRGPARRPGRSLTCVGLLAAGVFLTVSIRAFHIDATARETQRSGTGGFALYAESSLPIYRNLNDPAVRRDLRLPPEVMRDVTVVPMRLRTGDEASCLNLNRAQRPRILGVDGDDLDRHVAFDVASQLDLSASGWSMLRPEADSLHRPRPRVPAIADEPTLTWALGKTLGETVTIMDDRGRSADLVFVAAIASSILQGSVIIDKQAFVDLFPDEAGWQVFLIDAPPKRAQQVAEVLTRRLADAGLSVTPAVERLGQFAEVQNTYLRIFSVLGGLGLLLGSGGLAVVVLRNVLERRGELALLRAVGYTRGSLRRLIVGEHLLLVAAGLVIGGVAAGVAIMPSGGGAAMRSSLQALAILAVAVAMASAGWTALATRWATRGRLLPALRDE